MSFQIKRNVLFLFFLSSVLLANAQSVGGTTSGTTAFCDTVNSGFISLTGYVGAIVNWESSTDGGVTWTSIANPTSTQSYNNVKQNTLFRAIIKNGTFPQDTSTSSSITIHPYAHGGVVNGAGPFCLTSGNGTLTLSGYTGNVLYWENSINGGASWSTISVTTPSLAYTSITQNTLYRAIVQNIVSCPTDTSLNASFVISQTTIPGTLANALDTVCNGQNKDTINLSGNLGNVVDWIFSTNNGVTWTQIGNTTLSQLYLNITQTTLYEAIVKNGACPADTTAPAVVAVVNANIANAGSDQTIILYQTATLNGSGDGDPTWTPNLTLTNPTIFNPIASPLRTTTYVLTIDDRHSCTSTDSVLITVIIPIPTAFTPNGDGTNDYFVIDDIGDYPQNAIQFFNRWGNSVYKSSPYKNDWNGKSSNGQDLPDDVYYYTLDYANGDKPITGYVLIKR